MTAIVRPVSSIWHRYLIALLLWLVLLALWSMSATSRAESEQIAIVNELSLIPGLMMFRDSSTELGLADVLSSERLSQWHRLTETPNLGRTSDHIWLAFGLK